MVFASPSHRAVVSTRAANITFALFVAATSSLQGGRLSSRWVGTTFIDMMMDTSQELLNYMPVYQELDRLADNGNDFKTIRALLYDARWPHHSEMMSGHPEINPGQFPPRYFPGWWFAHALGSWLATRQAAGTELKTAMKLWDNNKQECSEAQFTGRSYPHPNYGDVLHGFFWGMVLMKPWIDPMDAFQDVCSTYSTCRANAHECVHGLGHSLYYASMASLRAINMTHQPKPGLFLLNRAIRGATFAHGNTICSRFGNQTDLFNQSIDWLCFLGLYHTDDTLHSGNVSSLTILRETIPSLADRLSRFVEAAAQAVSA